MPIYQNFAGLPGYGWPIIDAQSDITFLPMGIGQYRYLWATTSGEKAGGGFQTMRLANESYKSGVMATDYNNAVQAFITVDSTGRINIWSGTGSYYFKRPGSYIILIDWDTNEQFAQFVRQGANDWRIQIKQGGSWVQK